MLSILDLPRAHGGPLSTGRLRSVADDFIVHEWLGFEPDGAGDHWLLWVRKRDANTQWVLRQLAKLAKLPPREIGYAGLKDRHAVCEQAFTVPVRSAMPTWEGVSGEGFEVIGAHRHRRKLKAGALQGNDFTLVVRDFNAPEELLRERMHAIATLGVPNYFGAQRFGNEGSNLQRAYDWFGGGAQPTEHFQRSLALSAARAAIFNAVLAERVSLGNWNRLHPGEVANLDGSQSIFSVTELDATLTARCDELDIHPTGPLAGTGETKVLGVIAMLEERICSQHTLLLEGLFRAQLEQQRRALRVRPTQLAWELQGDVLQVRFRLRRGCFATAVLHEVLANAFGQTHTESVED